MEKRQKTPNDLEIFGSRLIARRWQSDEIGGIILPDVSTKVSLRGVVAAVGSGCVDIKVGDDIIFGRYAPFDLPTKSYEDLRDMPEFVIMNEEDVLLRINE